MDFKRLGRGDIVAAAGGALLLLSLFLPWFSIAAEGQRQGELCGAGSCTAFETFGILDILLVPAALAPWILVWIVARANELSWPPGELTMIVAMAALVLIFYNGLLAQPGVNPNFVSIDYGWFVGLLGAFVIATGGAMSQVSRGGRKRKPPGAY